jgi:hypothetical protein
VEGKNGGSAGPVQATAAALLVAMMSEERVPRTQVSKLSWLAALRSPQAPKSPVTRIVLQHLAGWMDKEGGDCFVGMEPIAKRAQLAGKTVKRHLQWAYEHGWIHRWYRTGRKRDGYAYQATLPDAVLTGSEQQSPAKPARVWHDARPPADPMQRSLLDLSPPEPVKRDSESLLTADSKRDSEGCPKGTESPPSSNYEYVRTTHPHPLTPSPSADRPASDDDDDPFADATGNGTSTDPTAAAILEAWTTSAQAAALPPRRRRRADDQVARLASGDDLEAWTHPDTGTEVPVDCRVEVFRTALQHIAGGKSTWPRGAVMYEVAASWECLPGTEAAAVAGAGQRTAAPSVDDWIRENPERHQELLELAETEMLRDPVLSRNRGTSVFRGRCTEWVRMRIREELSTAGATHG